jgi:3-deoxy-manno-octulosonate cytidylyltransferase (CMP-KDO synthetase)
MTTVAVIPARYASTRFPGKALAPIAGKPMVLHVGERVRAAKTVDHVTVATDDERIMAVCRDAGFDAIMTGSDHETGTDRLAEVATLKKADIYVNVQGDEPLIAPEGIDNVVRCLSAARARGIEVATGYVEGATPDQEISQSVVHLVPTVEATVLAFSRLPIPCGFRAPYRRNVHVGLYAFTGAALARFAAWKAGPVERAESIELMRFLEHGEAIACVAVPPGSIGVDHPEDVVRVEAILAAGR